MLHLATYKLQKLLFLQALILKACLICYSADDGFCEFPDQGSGCGTIGMEDGNDKLTVTEMVLNELEFHKESADTVDGLQYESSLIPKLNQEEDSLKKDSAGRKPPEHTTAETNNLHVGNRPVGHVIGVAFWDQQTMSVGRLLSMQCWAGHHDMVVAEPFMIDSKFGAPLTAEAMKHNDTMVRLGRLYDLDHWNEYSKKRGYAPMVEWKEFLHQAPRDVIIVEFKGNSLQALRKEYSKTLNPHGFQVVKELHLDYKSPSNKLSMDDFATHVFGNYSPSDVTIIFSEWSRVVNMIVDLNSVHCHATHTDYDVMSPSKEVNESTEAYIENQFGGGEYNAVMLRLEWIVSSGSQEKAKEAVSSCLHKTIKRLEVMMDYTGVKSTFVAVDSGKYGSKTSYKLNSDFVLEQIQVFLKTVYGNSSSLQHWESTFEEISKNTSPGYIGYLQKVIATRAKCLLLTGSSTSVFHRHALRMYKELHRGTNDACYAVVNIRCAVDISEGVALD